MFFLIVIFIIFCFLFGNNMNNVSSEQHSKRTTRSEKMLDDTVKTIGKNNCKVDKEILTQGKSRTNHKSSRPIEEPSRQPVAMTKDRREIIVGDTVNMPNGKSYNIIEIVSADIYLGKDTLTQEEKRLYLPEKDYFERNNQIHAYLKYTEDTEVLRKTNTILKNSSSIHQNKTSQVKDFNRVIESKTSSKTTIELDNPIHTKLTGVTYENRQSIISNIKLNDDIYVQRDYNNVYDCHAIGVYLKNGNAQIGWIPKDLASQIAPQMDDGITFNVAIKNKLGGDAYNYGVEVVLRKNMDDKRANENQHLNRNFQLLNSFATMSVNELLDKGVSLKRQGDFYGAKACYVEALKRDPSNIMIYISLGKIAYLLRDEVLSINCYLASMHLQLFSVENHLKRETLPFQLEIQLNSLSQIELESLPRRCAFIILIDPNTPNHIAHAVLDFSHVLVELYELNPYIEIYHAKIAGNGTYERLLKKYKLTTSDEMDKLNSMYYPYGQNYLLNNIQWNQISSSDVVNIYKINV